MIKLNALTKSKPSDLTTVPFALNTYFGCPYACKYCYAQETEFWRDWLYFYGGEPRKALVRKSIDAKLRKDLERLATIEAQTKEVEIGSLYDPYPSIEVTEKVTRHCLELFLDYPEWIVHLMTKSPMITRDLDVFRQMDHFQAEITITSIKDAYLYETKAPSVESRLDAIRTLTEKGIYVRVIIMPVLKGYTNIEEIKRVATECGVKDFMIGDLRSFTEADIHKWCSNTHADKP
jgi:DNA repair photolyase